MDVGALHSSPMEDRHLFRLPTEIRLSILEYVFETNRQLSGFTTLPCNQSLIVDEDYTASTHLQPLFTCRQLYSDAQLLALTRTAFVCSNLFFHIPTRLSLLHPKQVAAIRNIAFVADARHFRKLLEWGTHPFGVSELRLDTLTIVLHRSSHWHYLFDFTADITRLLRVLEGVKRLVFVRNNALVKGSFKTWYNRLIGRMLTTDRRERYEMPTCTLEKVWWLWSYDANAQTFCLEATDAKPRVDEATYMQQMAPLREELRHSIENEEWNPDPRSRNMYY